MINNNVSIPRANLYDVIPGWEKPARPSQNQSKEVRFQNSLEKVNAMLSEAERDLRRAPPGFEVVIDAHFAYRGECQMSANILEKNGIKNRCCFEEKTGMGEPLSVEKLRDSNTRVDHVTSYNRPPGMIVNGKAVNLEPRDPSSNYRPYDWQARHPLAGGLLTRKHFHVVSLKLATEGSQNSASTASAQVAQPQATGSADRIVPAVQGAAPKRSSSDASKRICMRNWAISLAVVVLSATCSIFASIYAQQK